MPPSCARAPLSSHHTAKMGNAYSQSRPPAPTFTEVDLPDLRGKVYIITGGASGVGAELAEILYNAGGTVYIVGRSEANALHAISRMTECCGDSAKAGKLNYNFSSICCIFYTWIWQI